MARIVDELAAGELRLSEVKDELKGLFDPTTATMVWMKNKRMFKEAILEFYEAKYEEWRDKGRDFKLVYIQGGSGIGKTKFAKKLGRLFNEHKGYTPGAIHNAPNMAKGSGRFDFLNSYDNEAVTVFDDIDPTTFGYTEFLTIFERERMAKLSSRFNDKAWFAELAIITKSTDIDEFTKKLSYSELRTNQSSGDRANVLYQPRRRFSFIVDLAHDEVKIMGYELIDKKDNRHRLSVKEIISCPEDGFHDEEFQDELLRKIATYLGIEEPNEKALSELEELNPDEEQLGRLKEGGNG